MKEACKNRVGDQDTEYDYMVKQSCLPAGSTEQNGARVKATIDFYLCCNDQGSYPGKFVLRKLLGAVDQLL